MCANQWVGGQSTAPMLAMAEVLTMHERLGVARKVARFRYLRRRWMDRVGAHRQVRLLTVPTFSAHAELEPSPSMGLNRWPSSRSPEQHHVFLVRAFGAPEWDGPAGFEWRPMCSTRLPKLIGSLRQWRPPRRGDCPPTDEYRGSRRRLGESPRPVRIHSRMAAMRSKSS